MKNEIINDLEHYVENAIRTESVVDDLPCIVRHEGDRNSRIVHALIGLMTECGESLDAIKKHVWYGDEFDKVNFLEEIGDKLWYLAILSDAHNVDFMEYYNFYGKVDKIEKEDHKDMVRLMGASAAVNNTASDMMAKYLVGSYVGDKISRLFRDIGILIAVCQGEWEPIAVKNIKKLQKRFPDKFTKEAALNRNLEAERKILEEE